MFPEEHLLLVCHLLTLFNNEAILHVQWGDIHDLYCMTHMLALISLCNWNDLELLILLSVYPVFRGDGHALLILLNVMLGFKLKVLCMQDRYYQLTFFPSPYRDMFRSLTTEVDCCSPHTQEAILNCLCSYMIPDLKCVHFWKHLIQTFTVP